MLKKTLFLSIAAFNIFFIYYLCLPLPQVPDLTNSAKSNLPGDTTQLINVHGYFTNQSRTEVINFYKANFNGPFKIQLNHPPEKSKDIFRDTMQSYYLEEFVLPFKMSLFVNGFEWENDVFTKPEKRIANKLLYEGKEYKAKINTKVYTTTLPQRLIAFFATQLGIFAIFYIYKSILNKKWQNQYSPLL